MKIYQTEEQQVASMKRWWRQNGTAAIVGIIIGLASIAGWNYWQSHLQTNAHQASSLYEQLLKSVNEENVSESVIKDNSVATEKIAEQISTQYSSLAYATYAALLLAKTKVQQGDLQAAKVILKKQVQAVDSVVLKHVFILRLIRVLQAMGEYEEGLQLIAEVDQANIIGFSANYNELKGDLYVALDRIDEARIAYQAALSEDLESPLLQFKLNDIAVAEFDDPT